MEKIELLKQELVNCKNEQQVIEAKNKFIKEQLNPLKESIKSASLEQKKQIGIAVNELKNQINEIVQAKLDEFQTVEDYQSIFSNNDYNLATNHIDDAKMHILNKTILEISEFFKKLNFSIVNGSEIVTDVDNFQRLNIPENHPARNSHDSLFINKDLLLRTHCTASTANIIHNNKSEDIRILSYGNVYRKDDDDATHSHQFVQLDFVWIKENLNISNLKWLVDSFLKSFFGEQIKTRYRLSFFPFTEPSFEVDLSCVKCQAKGCNVCKQSGWIEIMGAGILHPNVLKEANITNKSGIAAGIGIERIVMLKYGFTDIRDLYANLLTINKQFKH